MFHFGNVYLQNKKSDLVIQTLWIIDKFFMGFNSTLALYILEINMHNGFQVVYNEFLKTNLSAFYKRIGNVFEFFFLVYIQLILQFLGGEMSPNCRYHKVEKQNPCWCTKIYWKRNEMKWNEKNGCFLSKQPHWGHKSTFDRQRFDYQLRSRIRFGI
jgi:hypothetical protein